MLCLGVYTTIIVYIETQYYPIKSTSTVHSLLGFVISLLLVFRTNTAYDRWWEGRKLLGSLLNNSRNLALKLASILKEDSKHKEEARIMISNYALALVEHLSEKHKYYILKDQSAYPISEVLQAEHKPNAVALQLMNFVQKMVIQKCMTTDDLRYIKFEISSFTEIVGACERIKKSPIPYSYSLFIKKFIFVYIITIPIFFSQDFGYAIVPLTIFIFYVLVSIEMIAEEIEDPFNGDSNDLPMHEISQNIRKNIKEILKQ
jgi:putative membrane protein